MSPRRALSVLSVLSAICILSSCHKLRALAGDPSAQQDQQATPTKITGFENGQEINVNPGPPPTPSHAGADQGWHVQPLKCGVEERMLGMCGNAPLSTNRSSTYTPSYATPQVSPFHQRYGKWSRSH